MRNERKGKRNEIEKAVEIIQTASEEHLFIAWDNRTNGRGRRLCKISKGAVLCAQG